MLECRGVSVRYGQHQALDDVSVSVAANEIVVILGANGAGKSTLLKAIAGLVPFAEGGQIRVGGRSLAGLPPHAIVEAGVALVPEGRQLFGDLTVEENLLLGAHARRARAAERANLERVFALFPRLAERRRQVARTMSGGEQQMVAIGRAVMSAPTVLMLDEPSLGLSPLLCGELFRTLGEIRHTGVGILLVEQNARQALAIADRGYLLEVGRIVGEDTAHSLAQTRAVQEAYLGVGGEEPAPTAAVAAAAPAATAPAATAAPAALSATSGAHGPSLGRPAHGPSPSAIAAQAIAAAQATGLTTGPSNRAAGSRTDALAGGSIAGLVQRAAEVQTEHVRTVRTRRGGGPLPAGGGAWSASTAVGELGGGEDALAAALARIEDAAALARTRRPGPRAVGGNGLGVTGGTTGGAAPEQDSRSPGAGSRRPNPERDRRDRDGEPRA